MKQFKIFLKNLSQELKLLIFSGLFIYLIIYSINLLLPLLQKEFINRSIQFKKIDFLYFTYLLLLFGISYIFEIFDSIYDKILSTKIYKYIRLKFLEFFKYFRLQKVKEKGSGYFIQKYFMGTPHADMYSTLFSNMFTFIFDTIIAIAIYVILFKWIKIIALLALLNSLLDLFFVSLMTSIYSKENRKEMETISLSAKEIGNFINTFTSTGIFSTFFYFKNGFTKNFFQSIKHFHNYKNAQIIYLSIFKHLKTILFQIATIYFLVFYFIKGNINFGTFIAINLYLEYLKKPQNSYFSIANSIASLTSFFSGFYNYFNQLLLPFEEIFSTEIITNIRQDFKLSFKNVILKKDNKVLLDNLTFSLNKNEKIGIVGLSGEGKSLLLKLILREMKIQNGIININNTSISNIAYGYYLNRINFMPQEIEILNKDLISNITLGKKLILKKEKEQIYKNIYNEVNKNLVKIKKNYYKYYKNLVNYYNKNKDIINKTIDYKTNLYKKSLKYLSKLSKKIKMDENYHDTFSYFGLFFKEQSLNFLFNYCHTNNNYPIIYKYFININKLLKIEQKLLVEIISNFHFNKLFVIKEDVDNIINKLELQKLEGRDFGESGHFISGGEKQKIAIARFMLKKDFDFFIIDEPFSSLDAINEKKLLDILTEFLKNKTGIIISHRLNVINAITNKIIVIDNGKIAQTGTHKELMSENGLYKDLVSEFKQNKDI